MSVLDVTTEAREHLYRYEENGNYIYLRSYPVIKHTPQGVWIQTGAEWTVGGKTHKNRKFVLSTARKHWACSTKEEAWRSFRMRKRNQVAILERQLERATAALLIAKLLPADPRPTMFMDDDPYTY